MNHQCACTLSACTLSGPSAAGVHFVTEEDTMGMDAQAGGTWANSSGLGWAISSMGLSRPAAQGSMSVSSVPTSAGVPVPSVAAPSAAASFASSAAIPQATPQRHDDVPQEPGQSPCHLLSCLCISAHSGEYLPRLANPGIRQCSQAYDSTGLQH